MIKNFLNLLEKAEKKNKKVVFNTINTTTGNTDPTKGPINSTPMDMGSALTETKLALTGNTYKPFLVTLTFNSPEYNAVEKRFDFLPEAKAWCLQQIKEINYLNAVDDKKVRRILIQNLERGQEVIGTWTAKKGWSAEMENLQEEGLEESLTEAPTDKGPWDADIKKNISELDKEEEVEESLNESTATHLEVAFSTPEESGYDSGLVKEFKNISKEDALKQAKKEIDIKSVYTKGDSMFAKVAWDGSWDGYDPMVRIGETEDILNTIGVDSSDDAEWELKNNWDKYEDIFFFDVEEDVEDYEESLDLTEAKADQQKFIDKFGEKAFELFNANKQRIKNKNVSTDILWHVKNTSTEDMEKLLDELSQTLSKTKQAKQDLVNGADLVYSDDFWKIYHVHTYEAAKKLGSGTTWCITGRYPTSSGDVNGAHWFNQYIHDHNLDDYYIMLNITNRDSATGDYVKYCLGRKKNNNQLVFIYNAKDNEISQDGIPSVPANERIQFLSGTTIPYRDLILINGCTIKNGIVRNSSSAHGNLVLPEEAVEIRSGAFKGSNIEDLTIPNTVIIIGNGICADCKRLEHVDWPNNVSAIPSETFKSCSALQEITLPEGVTTIGPRAFMNCSALQKINLPSSLRTIDKEAFKYCINLTELILPEGVEFINSDAFKGCMFDYLGLPSTIKELANSGQIAARGGIAYNGSKEDWVKLRTNYKASDIAFYGVIPESLSEDTDIYNMSFKDDLPDMGVKVDTELDNDDYFFDYEEDDKYDDSWMKDYIDEAWFDEDDEFFTREELDEFVSELKDDPDLANIEFTASYITNNLLEIEFSYKDWEDNLAQVKIDMRKIERPSDLYKYLPIIKEQILAKIKEIDSTLDEDYSGNESELKGNFRNKKVFIKLKNGATYVRKVLDQGHRAGGHEILVIEDPDFTSKLIKVDDILTIREVKDGDQEKGPIKAGDWSSWFNSLID